MILASIGQAAGQSEYSILYSFTGGSDGGGVFDSVTLDLNGNVYGTTSGGGQYGAGVVFELARAIGGSWDEAVLHSFDGYDGSEPHGGLAIDALGNLFGTTEIGGAYDAGVVFQLTPSAGDWNYTLIQNLGGPNNPACCPWGNLAVDARDNVYGAGNAAFELSPGRNGWTESILHVFSGQNGDGYFPQAGPIMDAAGNLYGTTAGGGLQGSKCEALYNGCGTVYELHPVGSGGGWRELILHRFGVGDDGVTAGQGALAADAAGDLYGTAQLGGRAGYGVVYKLTRVPAKPNGLWQETILYNFEPGAWGSTGVTFGADGNLYGTAINGGAFGCGVIYKLSPSASGEWQFTFLHSFTGSDGCQPDANLTLGPDGNLYGTAITGGSGGAGVVFEITP